MSAPAKAHKPRQGGFASMTPTKRAAIASMGGRAAHAKGTAHRFTPAEAIQAGRKGAASRAAKRKKDMQ